MNPRTAATLNELEEKAWFTKVGVQDAPRALVLSSWQDAMFHSTRRRWENLRLDAANRYRRQLITNSPQRFRQWNDIVGEIREIVRPFVARKTEVVQRSFNLPEKFENRVRWDILHLCMEAEYADVCPPGFYAGLSYWYANGHFPCGWDGAFPSGRIIIY